jgi:hypothetical protein
MTYRLNTLRLPARLAQPTAISMESADARTALLSIHFSRNARTHESGTKSVPLPPHRSEGRRAGHTPRSQPKRPGCSRVFAGGRTIYGISEACPTLAALGRLQAGDERWRRGLIEAFGAGGEAAGSEDGRVEWEAADEMFQQYIDIEQCCSEDRGVW